VQRKSISAVSFLGSQLLTSVLLMSSFSSVAQTQSPFDTLQRQVTNGQYEEAYKLGKTMPSAQSDPHFNFLFGVAAINIGRTPEGILALERHLVSVPGNDRARLDLARGYFELGDYVRARSEFEFVLRYNPPKDVRDNIERYLNSMQTRDAVSLKASTQLYLEVGVGTDSNVNAGTYNSQITLPTGPVVLADTTSREISSPTYTQAGAGQWVKRVAPAFAVFGGGDFNRKQNPSASVFNTFNASLNTGFSILSGAILYKVTVADSVMFVDNKRYRGALSATGEAQYGYGDGLIFNGALQYSEQSYIASNSIRDSKSVTYGAGLQKLFSAPWRPALGVQLSRIEEQNLNKRDDLNRNTNTMQISLAVTPVEKLGLLMGVSTQQSGFGAADIAFATVRRDRLRLIDLSAHYALSRNWGIRGEIQWTQNNSNQDLYSFNRKYVMLKSRYIF